MTIHGKSDFFLFLSGRCMPKLLKTVFTFKFHPSHANISTPTGTPIHDKKVKELSSIEKIGKHILEATLAMWWPKADHTLLMVFRANKQK